MVGVSVHLQSSRRLASALVMGIVFTAVPREDLGNKSKQKDSYKDRHVGD